MIELRFPESPIVLDPLERAAHRRRAQRRAPNSTFLLHGRELGALEHAHVLGDGGERHVESRGELADRAVAGGEAREYVAPRGVGEGKERVVERSGMVNHTV